MRSIRANRKIDTTTSNMTTTVLLRSFIFCPKGWRFEHHKSGKKNAKITMLKILKLSNLNKNLLESLRKRGFESSEVPSGHAPGGAGFKPFLPRMVSLDVDKVNFLHIILPPKLKRITRSLN